jgi:hypothetical protein
MFQHHTFRSVFLTVVFFAFSAAVGTLHAATDPDRLPADTRR